MSITWKSCMVLTSLIDFPINIAPAALQRASGGQPLHGGQPPLSHWVAQRCAVWWASGGLLAANLLWAQSIRWPSSVPSDFMLDWFWPPTANAMLPLCLNQWHRLGFQPSATGCLVEACLLCAKPPHFYQRPTGGPLDVIGRPAWPQ